MRFASVLLPALAPLVVAFAPQSKPFAESRLLLQTKLAPEIPAPKDISYGEESRKYRRTVYSHDDWVKFRSPDRFLRNLYSLFASGVYKNLGREVTATTAVAIAVVAWNALTGGYKDFSGVAHEAMIQNAFLPMLTLPLTPFTLVSPSLGLLLGKCSPATRRTTQIQIHGLNTSNPTLGF